MGQRTNIQWASDTWNPWRGCTKISPGCANCYAETLVMNRMKGDPYVKGKPRIRHKPATFDAPLIWNRKPWVCNGCGTPQGQLGGHCIKCGSSIGYHRRRVFSLSLGDWLDPEVPIEWLADMLSVAHRCQELDILLLTKRPELWRGRLEDVWGSRKFEEDSPWAWLQQWLWFGVAPKNIWLGCTIENQDTADDRRTDFANIPAFRKFVSYEPALGPVNWDGWSFVDWLIIGCESGPKRREFKNEWASETIDWCVFHRIAPFVKQVIDTTGAVNTTMSEWPPAFQIQEFPKAR